MKYPKKYLLTTIFLIVSFATNAQNVQLALMKYNGGGDWYANPTSLTNLIAVLQQKPRHYPE